MGLFEIDLATLNCTEIGDFGAPENFYALEYAPGHGLYGVSWFSQTLYSIDPETAALTAVGNTGINHIKDLAFDPASGKMFACASLAVWEIDMTTGQALPFSYGVMDLQGLATPAPTPEPATWVLLACSGVLAAVRRRRGAA